MESEQKEILRYLGARATDSQLDALIADCQLELASIVQPRYLYTIFGPTEYPCIRQGKAINRHLRGAQKWALLATTLGGGVDRRIDRYQVSNLTRSVVLNACATQAIEAVCAEAMLAIESDSAASGLLLGPRFSPGYADYPLSNQEKILAILDAGRRIGLTCTESFFLIPKKSVTALAALRTKDENKGDLCPGCSLADGCCYRRDAND